MSAQSLARTYELWSYKRFTNQTMHVKMDIVPDRKGNIHRDKIRIYQETFGVVTPSDFDKLIEYWQLVPELIRCKTGILYTMVPGAWRKNDDGLYSLKIEATGIPEKVEAVITKPAHAPIEFAEITIEYMKDTWHYKNLFELILDLYRRPKEEVSLSFDPIPKKKSSSNSKRKLKAVAT